jgi:hypothetical protein
LISYGVFFYKKDTSSGSAAAPASAATATGDNQSID